jgi:DNA-binding NarL/FixJ family response regulator
MSFLESEMQRLRIRQSSSLQAAVAWLVFFSAGGFTGSPKIGVIDGPPNHLSTFFGPFTLTRMVSPLPSPLASSPDVALRPITVAVLEDETHVRKMFEAVIAADPGLQLAFSAQTVAQAKDLALTHAAQVYLVDLGLPDADGREFIRWVTENQPSASAMVVTVFGDDEHIVSSFAAGAVGYLLKDAPADEIAQHIADLVGGGSPISPSVARRMLQHFKTQNAIAAPQSSSAPLETYPAEQALSPREHEVLCLIEKGLTYEEIAQILGITWHTVTGYLRRVYRKLEVNSRGEAVFEARQRGLL